MLKILDQGSTMLLEDRKLRLTIATPRGTDKKAKDKGLLTNPLKEYNLNPMFLQSRFITRNIFNSAKKRK